MAFQSKIVNLICFGQFLELSQKENDFSFRIALDGLTVSVPVSKEVYDNPPLFGQPGMVRGALTTNDYNGRPAARHVTWTPLTDENLWPNDGIYNRFEGYCTISKDSFKTKLGESVPFLRFDAAGFTYQWMAPQDQLDRFNTGEHTIFGQLKVDQAMNLQYKNKVTIWKCIPLGIINPKKAPKNQ